MAGCENSYEKYDSCYAVVRGRNRSGIFLVLDDGSKAFSFKCSNLKAGTEVLCTILRLPRDGKDMLVGIDSVIRYVA